MKPIEEQNRFLFRHPEPYWNKRVKRYDLKQCECGATQEDDVVTIYAGTGDFGGWNIYCRNCKLRSSAPSEKEAVEKWNRGETYRNCT